MIILRARSSFLLLAAAAIGLACRDAASNPTRPNFAVAADDTLPPGCSRTACNFNAFGDAAFVSWTDVGTVVASDTGGGGGGTIRFGTLSVSRGGALSEQQTFLSYNIVECGPSFCGTIAGGFGLIPNGDFSAGGQSDRLATNTASNPQFFTFAGPAGNISVEWVRNGLFEQRFNGTSEISFPGLSERTAGQSTNSSAAANGVVVGFEITAGNSGQVSSDHQVRITINR